MQFVNFDWIISYLTTALSFLILQRGSHWLETEACLLEVELKLNVEGDRLSPPQQWCHVHAAPVVACPSQVTLTTNKVDHLLQTHHHWEVVIRSSFILIITSYSLTLKINTTVTEAQSRDNATYNLPACRTVYRQYSFFPWSIAESSSSSSTRGATAPLVVQIKDKIPVIGCCTCSSLEVKHNESHP